MATTYRLLIAIEHTLPNWPHVDYRKKEFRERGFSNYYET